MRRIFFFMVFLLGVSSWAMAYFSYPALDKIPCRLKVSFRTTPYHLKVKIDEAARDKGNRRARLFALYKKKEIKVLRPGDLLKIIPPLRTKAETMAFVRLFTDGNTHKLFMAPGALEVFIVAKNRTDLLNDDNYGWGLVHPRRAKELGLKPATIRKTRNGFVIQRTVVFYPQEQKVLRLVEISEQVNVVSKTYSLKETRVVSTQPWVERFLVRINK